MNFLKYLLRCLMSGIAIADGHGDLVSSNRELGIGLLEILIGFVVFSIFAFKIFKKSKHPVLYSILATCGIIIIFAIACIVIELIIK